MINSRTDNIVINCASELEYDRNCFVLFDLKNELNFSFILNKLLSDWIVLGQYLFIGVKMTGTLNIFHFSILKYKMVQWCIF